MAEITLTVLGREFTLPFMQALVLAERIDKLTGAGYEVECHWNQCGCCIAVHPKGQHDRGYVIDSDGGYDWVGPGNPEEESQ